MQRLSHQLHRFDGFTLDLTRGCLLRGTQEIKLQPKPFGALTYLIENPGRLIEKAELIQMLWPDTAVTNDLLPPSLGGGPRRPGEEEPQNFRTANPRGPTFYRPGT